MTLGVKAERTILRVKEVLLDGLLLMESKDGKECHEHSKHCAPCHLPIDNTIHRKLAIMPMGFSCFVCGEKEIVDTMLLCNQLAHGMPKATLDFSTIWRVELSSLSRIFGTWCFYQLYSMIISGFHHVVPAQMENKEL